MRPSHEQPLTLKPELYLFPDEQDLLVAALVSNKPREESHPPNQVRSTNASSVQSRSGILAGAPQMDALPRPGQAMEPSFLDNLQFDEGSFNDYELDLGLENPLNVGGIANHGPPSTELQDTTTRPTKDGEVHDKRKNPDDDDTDDDGGSKRREGAEKTAKKPGRKPLTSEPTTKRKAQNRAAQRAFRERKEKHLKDLETKVEDLERASESANHENGLLRAHVTRLQDELRQYRRRISANARPAPPLPSEATADLSRKTTGMTNNNFRFDFPKFGSLPGSYILANGSFAKNDDDMTSNTTGASAGATAASKLSPPLMDVMTSSSVPGVLQRNPSSVTLSPRAEQGRTPGGGFAMPGMLTTTNGRASGSVDMSADKISPLNRGSVGQHGLTPPEYFQSPAPSLEKEQNRRKGSQSSMGRSFVPQPNRGHLSASASPSVSSSISQQVPGSSTCTSPDPDQSSPSSVKLQDSHLNSIGEELASQGWQAPPSSTVFPSLDTPTLSTTGSSNIATGIDWLVQQNGGQFDPVLFGDYREPQDAITSGDYSFLSDAFPSDAFPVYNFGSPLNEQYTPSPTTPKEAVSKTNHAQTIGVGTVAPGESTKLAVDCDRLWNHIQQNEHFKNGQIDIDDLCHDLKKKAVCSETGVPVDQPLVDALLVKYTNHQQHRQQQPQNQSPSPTQGGV